MDSRRLHYFLVVAEELHFGRAAARLHLHQPPLSQQIQKLEAELGVRLFDRSSRRVRLTDAGRVLVAEGKRLLAADDRAVELVQRADRGQIGRLAIGFISSASYELLPSVLRLFRQRRPDVPPMIQVLNSRAQIEAIEEGRLDVGFLRAPLTRPEGVNLEVVASERVLAFMPHDHPLASYSSIELGQLAGEPVITYPRGQAKVFYDQLVGACLSMGFSPNVVLEAVFIPAIVTLVASGLGIAPLPASAVHFNAPGVVHRPFDPPIFDLDLAIGWGPASSELAEVFLAVTREAVRTTPLTSFTLARDLGTASLAHR